MSRPLTRLVFLLALFWSAVPAAQAETFHTCKYFITSLPTMITNQGTWCMSQDLVTSIGSGNAIDIKTNNVTIDCNDFKLGGLQAGASTATTGINAAAHNGITIRHCNIRGFFVGIDLDGGAGHQIEDSSFSANTSTAIIDNNADGVTIRNNVITDTGGSTIGGSSNAIIANSDTGLAIRDNSITGVTVDASFPNAPVVGIHAGGSPGALLIGNQLSTLTANGVFTAEGIILNDRAKAVGNALDDISSPAGAALGFDCLGADIIVKDNLLSAVTTAYQTCVDGGGNYPTVP